jgi:adenylosuccinate lyase
MLLSGKLGRELTSTLIERAVAQSVDTDQNFVDVLAGMREVMDALDAATLRDLLSPESYLGAAEEFRCNLVGSQKQKQRQSGSDNRKERET